jgi:lipoprotein NlpI
VFSVIDTNRGKFSVFWCDDRGLAWCDKKEYDRAIHDLTEAIRLDPKNAPAHFGRSVTQMLARRANAGSGFRTVIDLQGWHGNLSTYAVILGHLTASQETNSSQAVWFLTESSGRLDEKWPYPVVQFLRGNIDEARLLQLAVDDDKRTEARCFLGMQHALAGRRAEALAHYRWVKRYGNPNSTEYTIAVAELDRLERSASSARLPK